MVDETPALLAPVFDIQKSVRARSRKDQPDKYWDRKSRARLARHAEVDAARVPSAAALSAIVHGEKLEAQRVQAELNAEDRRREEDDRRQRLATQQSLDEKDSLRRRDAAAHSIASRLPEDVAAVDALATLSERRAAWLARERTAYSAVQSRVEERQALWKAYDEVVQRRAMLVTAENAQQSHTATAIDPPAKAAAYIATRAGREKYRYEVKLALGELWVAYLSRQGRLLQQAADLFLSEEPGQITPATRIVYALTPGFLLSRAMRRALTNIEDDFARKADARLGSSGYAADAWQAHREWSRNLELSLGHDCGSRTSRWFTLSENEAGTYFQNVVTGEYRITAPGICERCGGEVQTLDQQCFCCGAGVRSVRNGCG